jgi:protein archease
VTYRWGEHVGELELHVEAATERDVFADATRAFGELLAEEDTPVMDSRRVTASGHDRAVLLAEYLEELIFLAETEGFVPAALQELRLGDGSLEAVIGGARAAPPHLVKAVTYHRLAFERGGGGWRANALLDV